MNSKYNNSDRLEAVTDKEWREALDELTAYLIWRLMGRIKCSTHCETVLEPPSLDYYTEVAVPEVCRILFLSIEEAWGNDRAMEYKTVIAAQGQRVYGGFE